MNTGIKYIELDRKAENIIALKTIGKITALDIANLVDRLEAILSKGQKARLYVDLTRYEGSHLPVVKEKLAHFGTFWHGIERCAYVVDSGWMPKAIDLVDAVTPMHLRAFGADQDQEARNWILEN